MSENTDMATMKLITIVNQDTCALIQFKNNEKEK